MKSFLVILGCALMAEQLTVQSNIGLLLIVITLYNYTLSSNE